MKSVRCPKCGHFVQISVRGNWARAVCAQRDFETPWLQVPGFRVPSHYLRERLNRVHHAYLMVRGIVERPEAASGQGR